MNRILSTVLCLAIGVTFSVGAFQLGGHLAHADTPALLDAGPPRALLIDAGLQASGSAIASPTTATPAVDSSTLLDEYKELRAAYDALKGSKDGSTRTLLYAALLAAGLKLMLDLMKVLSDRLDRGKKYIPWIATSLAVPIALLGHYAAGASWFDSLVYAGAGPGAVVVHELLELFFAKKPETASQSGSVSIRLLSAFALVGIMIMTGFAACGAAQTGKQFLACTESAVIKELEPTVESILVSGVSNWKQQLEALAVAFGKDELACAVAAAESFFTSATSTSKTTETSSANAAAAARAAEYLRDQSVTVRR